MQFSSIFKSSPHCVASPDGTLVATLVQSVIIIRDTKTLCSVNELDLSSSLAGPILNLLWSPSSNRLLVSTSDQINLISVLDSSFNAVIKNPLSGSGKPSYIQFGQDDRHVLVFAPFGLKLLIFDTATSKALEISGPKFHLPASAPRGLSFRPHTGNLALLTRTGGRDFLAIFDSFTRKLQQSWHPDTADAQAVTWSPDGNWLLVWDSAAHGRRLLLYTSDGQLFRTIPSADDHEDEDLKLKPGIKLCRFSPDAQLCAMSDHTRTVAIMRPPTWREDLSLNHPISIQPSDTLQVWQEQIQGSIPSFVRAKQALSPPNPGNKELTPGCSIASFDASSTLLATRLDDTPSTLWIWDVSAAELRAVVIFHSNIEFQWHPSIGQLLMITCSDDFHKGVPFVWDPLSNGPTFMQFAAMTPRKEVTGKVHASWINWDVECPTLLISDSEVYCLLSLADSEHNPPPWQTDESTSTTSSSKPTFSLKKGEIRMGLSKNSVFDQDTVPLDDTFSFKNRPDLLAKKKS